MDPRVLDTIPFQLDYGALGKKLHVKGESSHGQDLRRLIDEAQVISKPKALYKMVFIESKGDDTVTVDGVTLTSRVLRVNLEQAHRVFPYTVTCGSELDQWSRKITDILLNYWAEEIKETVLYRAVDFFQNHLVEHYQLGQLSRMSPGSLADWPIEEQRPLFSLLGNTKDLIGVQLTDSLMMVPAKSVSGVSFPTEVNFVSCQLCPRELCPGRKAPYDEGLYDKKYRLTKGGSSHP